jgi:hypothetical protein
VSEKSITRQQAGLVRRARSSRRDSANVAGACSAAQFVVEGAGEEYDAPEIEPNRKSRIKAKGVLIGIPAKPLPWFGTFLQQVRQLSESEGVAVTVQFVEGLEGETIEK